MNAPTCPKCGTVYEICAKCKLPHVTCKKCGWDAKKGVYVKTIAQIAKEAVTPPPPPVAKPTIPVTQTTKVIPPKGKQGNLSIP